MKSMDTKPGSDHSGSLKPYRNEGCRTATRSRDLENEVADLEGSAGMAKGLHDRDH